MNLIPMLNSKQNLSHLLLAHTGLVHEWSKAWNKKKQVPWLKPILLQPGDQAESEFTTLQWSV